MSIQVNLYNFLRATHESFSTSVCIVNHQEEVAFEGELYRPYAFEIIEADDVGEEYEIQFADRMPLVLLESVGSCEGQWLVAQRIDIDWCALRPVARLTGILLYREGKAIFVVKKASVYA